MKLQTSILLVLILFLSSCSPIDLIEPLGNQPERTLADVLGQEDAYITVDLSQLHSESGSRSAAHASIGTLTTRAFDYADGASDEYLFHDAFLLFFAGADEANAQLCAAYHAYPGNRETGDGDRISAHHNMVQKIKASLFVANMNIYCLVVANGANVFKNDGPAYFCLKADSTTNLMGMKLDEINQKMGSLELADLQATDFTTTAYGSRSYFMMSNVPLKTAEGVQTLVKINPQRIYTSQTEAEQGEPAATINIQRLVAKVEMKLSGDAASDSRFIGWTIDNTNRRTYLTQVVDATWEAPRTDSMSTTDETLRYTFGKDPNFDYGNLDDTERVDRAMDDDSIAFNFNRQEAPPTTLNRFDSNTPLYCLENTFALNGMRDGFTTRVVVGYKWYARGDFYTVSSVDHTEHTDTMPEGMFNRTDMETKLKQAILSNHKFKEGEARVKELLEYEHRNDATPYDYHPVTENDLVLTLSEPLNGVVSILNINLTPNAALRLKGDSNATSLQIIAPEGQADYEEHIKTDVNNNTVVNYYKDGVCYYPVYIRHFYNTEEADWTRPTVNTQAYYTDNHLGRYGVVRNTWYEITISNAPTKIGAAGMPPYDKTYDDAVPPWLQPSIQVMPWVDRSYEYNFEY